MINDNWFEMIEKLRKVDSLKKKKKHKYFSLIYQTTQK